MMASVGQQNAILMRKLLVIVIIMAGFGYALVPLYRKICEVTGISQGRTVTEAIANTQVDASRLVTVEFVASTNLQMPWQFEPLERFIKVHPGELARVIYRVVNKTDRDMVGQAVASYGPADAGKYLNKLECFCFKQQSLHAGEAREMPVVFRISADIPTDMQTLTLSYTFFDVKANNVEIKG
jgi:cytochrome c oxidase assembly protein subunit 11